MPKKSQTAANPKARSLSGEIWHRFVRNKGSMVGGVIVLLLVLVAIFGNVLIDYDTQVAGYNIPERLQGPSLRHLFGTDEMGRDIFLRTMYGARYSLSIGVVATLMSMVVGITLGAIAGYFGKAVEEIIMRITDILSAVPGILLAVIIVASLGQSTLNLMIAMGVGGIPSFVRITRAAVLKVRGEEYIEACRAIGLRTRTIIVTHILPNCLSPIIVQATLRVAGAIVGAAGLSFIGLGVPLPSPEWGALLSAGRGFMRDYPYMTFFPGLTIMITVLALNLLGDGLRDAFDPKLKR